MRRVSKAAAALILMSSGTFLIYRGLHSYFYSQDSQVSAATAWHHTATITYKKRFIPEGETFSHLEVPRLNKSLYVVEGDNDSALSRGPGHVRGSAMPGEHGNCVIAGHRDLHFRFLKDVEPGDKVFLETDQGRFCYRITGTKIISPTQLQVLQPTRDAELHLITCYPFYFIGHAPKRFVVTAKLDSVNPVAKIEPVPEPPPRPSSRPHRTVVRHTPLPESVYERSLEATRVLNRAAAANL